MPGEGETELVLVIFARIGQVTNNADYVSTYVAEMAGRSLTPDNTMGPFIGNQSSPNDGVDFDLAYRALTPGSVRSTNANWTVRDGDTLQSMASAVWGDASLWYLIAEANGLTSASLLTVPARAGNVHNTTDTFRPYDPNEALGNLNPTQPKPPKKGGGCGVVGQIIVVAVAIAVTVAITAYFGPTVGTTAGKIVLGASAAAAGSVAGQAVGVAIRAQDSIDWKRVGISAISGGVGAGLGTVPGLNGAGMAAGAARGAAGSVITQGVAVATGLQDRFSWTDVAVSAVSGGVGNRLNKTFGVPQGPLETWNRGDYAGAAASAALSGIAGAGAQSLLEGSSFGDNLRAVLPQVIGQTIGNMVAGKIQAKQAEPAPGQEILDRIASGDLVLGMGGGFGGAGAMMMSGGVAGGGQPTAQRSLWQKIGGFFKDPIGSTVRAGRAFVGAIAERIDYTKASASATYASLSDDAIQLEDVVVTGVRNAGDNLRRTWTDFSSAGNLQPQRQPGFGETFISAPPPSNPLSWLNGDIGIRRAAVRDRYAYADGLDGMQSVTSSSATNTGLAVRAGLERLHAGFADQFAVPFGVIDTITGRPAEAIGLRWNSAQNVTGRMMAEPAIQIGLTFLGNPEVMGGSTAAKVTAMGRIESLATGSAEEFMGPLIGKSGFRTSTELAEAIGVRYQAYVDEAHGLALQAEAKGALRGLANFRVGNAVDRFSARDLKAFLDSEGISEGPNSMVKINRWLRDPDGTGLYGRPDVRIAGAKVTFDATIGFKPYNSQQITRYQQFSGGDRITVVRPSNLGGSYSIVP